AGTSICDLNLTTVLQHTFSAYLDITLQSPAGTIVTLTTDNGAGNDDVWNGTVWDDDANPAGQVPYTTNSGIVTDHAYVNLTLASPLVPEEALGAFLGEDPNGTWTLTISDDLAGDGGNLNNWSLDIDTCECPSADASITKTDGVPSEVPGTTVTYTIVASNAGPSMITGGTVADTFPGTLSACTWTCVGAGGGTCAANGAGNINDTVNLPSGGTATYTATCTIAASATGNLANTATVTHALPDPIPGNNSATDTDTLAPEADISVTKTDGLTNASPGQGSAYTIVVANAGPSNDPSVSVADTFPAEFTGVIWNCAGAGGGTCTANGSGNIADTANLPAGGSVTYTAIGTISGAFSGILSNTATATSSVTDPNGANNSATDTTTVGTPTVIVGTKSATGTFEAGGAVTYTIVLSNTGQTPQPDNTGDEFTDILPVGLTLTGASATSGTAATAGNTVTWNGTIPGNGSVTITIDATIDAGTEGLTLSNQGTFRYDMDGDGTNEQIRETDDPGTGDETDPTDIVVGGINVLEIPTLGEYGLMFLALMLAGLGFGVIRRRG
ncbi:MAG: IPTL-CTERM sorting domain-containing protein, partial [Thermoanaerobaculia bacterium]|nr:IPTL-CTERM sorting domain-containing protein [Thermoanaerobaculia bacterium]